MHFKKALLLLAACLLFCICALGEEAAPIRGYVQGQGYQYVQLGQYPYEKDGTEKPVLWRVLSCKDGNCLLLTEYVIDTSQMIFETDQRVIEKRTYRRISSYAESDLYPYLNSEGLDKLFGNDPIRNALLEEEGGGKLFILTSEQFLTTDYGFSSNPWNEQKSRQAEGTPYAIAQRNLYRDAGNGKCPYWAATIKGETDYKMQLVGYNGHLSWGAYTRVNVGLRLSVRLDMSQIGIASGSGTKNDPFLLSYTGKAASPTEEAAEIMPEATEEVVEVTEEMPEATEEVLPEATAEPTPETAVPEEATENVPEETSEALAEENAEEIIENNADGILLSFVGDCSIGDSIQYKNAGSSYHTCIDANGYDWPFSLVNKYLTQDDLTVANLENVFTTRTSHADKMYNLMAEPDHVEILKRGGIDAVNTVNNHALDFHLAGYQDSLSCLNEAGIPHFGYLYAARVTDYDDIITLQVKDMKIGFLGFSYPQDSDLTRIENRILKLRDEMDCDLVVVSLHWGRETHMTPESWQMTYARKVIDFGADVIWGHHPHVIQPIQFYKGKPIFYSTGNFTFGTMSPVDPSTGIFQLEYDMTDDGPVLNMLRVIPCETQASPDFRPYELTDEEARRAVFDELTFSKEYNNCENPPASFLDTGIVYFENGQMVP